jgi:hypothetical protein
MSKMTQNVISAGSFAVLHNRASAPARLEADYATGPHVPMMPASQVSLYTRIYGVLWRDRVILLVGRVATECERSWK